MKRRMKTGYGSFLAGMMVWAMVWSGVAAAGPYGENVDYWPGSSPLFRTDSMFLGATFLRDTSSPLEVWYSGNNATCAGWLNYMVPGYPDSAYALFTNRSEGAWVRLDTIFDIPHLDTLYFMYQVDMSIPTLGGGMAEQAGCDDVKRYTGPNRAPGEVWSESDRYYCAIDRNTTAYRIRLGRRHSVAGIVADNGVQTDTVQFAFEDKVTGGGCTDYDDIVFKVVGAFLMKPTAPLHLTVADQEVTAGDTVGLQARLSTSGDTIASDSSIYDHVTWKIVQATKAPGDTLLAVDGSTVGFTGTKAHRCVEVRASLEKKGLRELSATAEVCIRPRPADHITIEQDASPDLWTPDHLNSLVISSEKDTANPAYAFLRDAFDNLAEGVDEGNGGRATNAAWTSRDTTVVTAAGAPGPRAGKFKGIIVAAEPRKADSVWVVARELVAWAVWSDSVLVSVAAWEPAALRLVKQDTDSVIGDITMETGQSMPLEVQARHSNDPSTWSTVAAEWTLSGDITAGVPPSETSSTFTVEPHDTGTATLTVSMGSVETSIAITVVAGTATALPRQRRIAESPEAVRLVDLKGRRVEFPAPPHGTDGRPLRGVSSAGIPAGVYFVGAADRKTQLQARVLLSD